MSNPSDGLVSELGVAVGLANVYLRRCIKKGLVKVSQAPGTRYAYHLTRRGCTEKSRLAFEFMSHSFTVFGQPKIDCKVGRAAKARLCTDRGDRSLRLSRDRFDLRAGQRWSTRSRCHNDFAGAPVVRDIDLIVPPPDGVSITDTHSSAVVQNVIAKFGAERVLLPGLLAVERGDSR